MNDKRWFFKNGFLDWMISEFPKPMENHFTYTLVENVIDLLLESTSSSNEFVVRLAEIIPEVKEDEVREWINR